MIQNELSAVKQTRYHRYKNQHISRANVAKLTHTHTKNTRIAFLDGEPGEPLREKNTVSLK